MQKLNFPQFSFRFKNNENKTFIFDSVRKKFVLCTPEEWVRQHWLCFLTEIQQVPIMMIQVEKQIKVGQRQKRFDMIVYKKSGDIWLLLEFKEPKVQISQSTLNQINQYNQILKADYMVVSNGIDHKLFETKEQDIIFLNQLPKYNLI